MYVCNIWPQHQQIQLYSRPGSLSRLHVCIGVLVYKEKTGFRKYKRAEVLKYGCDLVDMFGLRSSGIPANDAAEGRDNNNKQHEAVNYGKYICLNFLSDKI